MALKIAVKQHKRKSLNGKWFGKAVSMGEVSTMELARKISHNNSVTEGDVVGVITALVAEMRNELQAGHTVVLDGIGRFHLTVKSDLVDHQEDYNVKRNVREVKVKFTPTAHRNPMTRQLEHPITAGVTLERL